MTLLPFPSRPLEPLPSIHEAGFRFCRTLLSKGDEQPRTVLAQSLNAPGPVACCEIRGNGEWELSSEGRPPRSPLLLYLVPEHWSTSVSEYLVYPWPGPSGQSVVSDSEA